MKHLERALDRQNQWWKYIVTFLFSFAGGNLIGSLPLLGVILYYETQGILSNPDNLLDFSVYPISQNLNLALLLLPFAVNLILIALIAKRMHRRSINEIINGTKSIRWSKIFFSAIVWTTLMGSSLIYSYLVDKENFVFQLEWSTWLPLLVVSLLLIPFQTTFEEVLFRGYFAQGIGVWTGSRWLAILIPGIVFGLLHSANPEVKEFGFWIAMPQYVLFGLLFGLISVLDDGIECAMGAHAANNIFLSLFLTHDHAAFQTPSAFKVLKLNSELDLIFTVIIFLIFLFILHRAYQWNFSILNKRIYSIQHENRRI